MRTVIAVLLFLAVGTQAMHFKHEKCRHEICSPKHWDRVFAIKHNNVIDPAPGQWAQKALNTVIVQTTAEMINEGLLPKGSKPHVIKPKKACYDSIIPGSLNGKQYAGEYEFLYDVGYDVPGMKDHMWVHVEARSYNRRNFPWFEVIETYVW